MAGTKGRRRWTEAEDRMLKELVEANAGGTKKKWRDVAAALPGRSEAQCQHRYTKVGGFVSGLSS